MLFAGLKNFFTQQSYEKTRQALFWILALLLFAFCFIPVTQYPIYNDEMAYRFRWGRYFADGNVITSLTPACASHFLLSSPWIFLPARYIDAFLYGDMTKAWIIRLVGVLDLLLWFVLVIGMMPRILEFKISRLGLFVFLCSIFGIGLMPYIMILNRPESILFIGISCFIIFPLWKKQYAGDERAGLDHNTVTIDLILAFASLFLIMYLCENHHKAILFLPIMVASAFYFLDRLWVKLLWLLGTAYITIKSYFWWQDYYTCPEVPIIKARILNLGLSPDLLFSNPLQFMDRALVSFLNAPKFIEGMRLMWLGDIWALPVSYSLMGDMVDLMSMVLFSFIVILIVSNFIYRFSKEPSPFLRPRIVMCLVTLLSIVIFTCINVAKAFYELELLIPLLLILLLVIFSSRLPRLIYYSLLFISVMTCLMSQSISLPISYRYAFGPWQKFGFIEDMHFQSGIYDSPEERQKIVDTAKMCGIQDAPSSVHVALDEVTYRAMQNTLQPYHLRHMQEPMTENYADLPLIDLFKQLKIGGVVASCYSTNRYPALRAVQYSSGNYCCLPPFNKLPAN